MSTPATFPRNNSEANNYRNKRKRPFSNDHRNRRPQSSNSRYRPPSTSRNRTRNHRRQCQRNNFPVLNDLSTKTCSVCLTADAKYKCPICRAAYCSVVCCREHKNSHLDNSTEDKKDLCNDTTAKSKYMDPETLRIKLQKKSTTKIITNNKHGMDSISHSDDTEDGWKITSEMINCMHESAWLHDELQDQGLRCLIDQISGCSNRVRRNNSSTEQEEVYNQLKQQNSRFRVFLDKLLVVTGILERKTGNENANDFKQWLKSDWNEEQLQSSLQLKPATNSQTMPQPRIIDMHDVESKSFFNEDGKSSSSTPSSSSSSSSSVSSSFDSDEDSSSTESDNIKLP